MSQIIKNISFVLTTLAFVLIFGGLISSIFFSDKIEKSVINSLKNQMPNNVNIDNVEFKLFKEFPFSTVKIKNLYVEEDKEFGNDTLLFAKEAYIKFSLIKFIFKKFSIDNITIFDGQVSINKKLNKSNYDFLLDSKSSENEIKLNEINLSNTNFKYISDHQGIKINLRSKNLKLNIIEKNIFSLEGRCTSENMMIFKKQYLENKNLNLKLYYEYLNGKSSLNSSFFQIEDLKFFVQGYLNDNNYIEINIEGIEQNIKSFTFNTPKYLKDIYSSILLNGTINYKAQINGQIGDNMNPNLFIEYELKNGVFETKKYPFFLNEISCAGTIENGTKNNFTSSQITFNNFLAKTKKGKIAGNFNLLNLKEYYLQANFSSEWEMSEANYYFSESPFYECSGKIIAKTNYNGRISFDKNFNTHFLNADHSSDIKLSNLNFLYKTYSNPIKVVDAEGQIINDSIYINNSLVNIKDSDLSYRGSINSLFNYIFNENKKRINLAGSLSSKNLNLKSIIGIDENSEEKASEFYMPDYLNLNLGVSVKTLAYNNIYPNNLKGNLILEKNYIKSNNLELNVFGGKLFFDGKFYENEKNNFKLTSNMKLEKVDIKKAFSSFNNFGQDFIIDKHIKGISNAQIISNMFWDKYLNLNYESIDVNSKISIEKGELLDFKPLESLSSYVKLEDLARIKFSKLENEIKIKDKIILVPNMEINSSALSLIISGKHYFNQEYNYKISLLLSDLLAKRFRAKDKSFNPNDSISPLKTDLQLRMKGNKDESEIYFEKLKIKENIQKEIKKEIIDVKKIIAEELNKKEKDEDSDDLEIEWDDSP